MAKGKLSLKSIRRWQSWATPAAAYADVLARRLGCGVAVCDREKIVAAAGAGRSELLGEPLPPELDALLARRKLYTAPEEPLHRVALGSRWLLCAAPVLVHGDIEGGVLLPGMRRDAVPDPETIRAAATAAEFLARWMGE